MPKKREQKTVPAHRQPLPPLPDKKDLEKRMKVAFTRYFPSVQSTEDPVIQQEMALAEQRHQAHLAELQSDFEETKNPLCAWDAYSICRGKKKPIPFWVMEYLDGVAHRMLRAENTTENLPAILGVRWSKRLDGGGSQAWDRYHTLVVRREAVAYVIEYLQGGSGIEAACDRAADRVRKRWGSPKKWRAGLTGEAVRKWYQRHKS